MKFHKSAFGFFGSSLPADVNGYVAFSDRKVRAIVGAAEAGKELPRWAMTGNNYDVALAEIAVRAWRRGR